MQYEGDSISPHTKMLCPECEGELVWYEGHIYHCLKCEWDWHIATTKHCHKLPKTIVPPKKMYEPKIKDEQKG